MTKRVLGIDTGTKNSAYSIVDHDGKNIKWRKTEMLPYLITTMSGDTFKREAKAFYKYFRGLLEKYKPDVVSPELFMQRSFRSNLASPINCMIGIMYALCRRRGIEFIPLMPATWKRRVDREITKIDNIYDRSYPIAERLPDHPVDSLLIGIYHNEKGYKCVTQAQLQVIIQKVKGSTSIQKFLEQEKLAVRAKAKAQRDKAKSKKPKRASKKQ